MTLFKSSHPPKRNLEPSNPLNVKAYALKQIAENIATMHQEIGYKPPTGLVALSHSICQESVKKGSNGHDKSSHDPSSLESLMADLRKVLIDAKNKTMDGTLHWPQNENHGPRTFKNEIIQAIKLLDEMKGENKRKVKIK